LAYYATDLRVVGVDLSFESRRPSNLVPIVGSGTALPFRDRAFDVVVCSDMLEHLAPTDRPAAIQETVRVSRTLTIIGFPSGRAAEAHDERRRRWLRRLGVAEYDWLREHAEHPYPTPDDVVAALPAGATVAWTAPSENLLVSTAVFLAELRLPERLMRRLDRVAFAHVLSPLVDARPAYRDVLVVHPPGAGQRAPRASASHAIGARDPR
jgi:hypothetical protein